MTNGSKNQIVNRTADCLEIKIINRIIFVIRCHPLSERWFLNVYQDTDWWFHKGPSSSSILPVDVNVVLKYSEAPPQPPTPLPQLELTCTWRSSLIVIKLHFWLCHFRLGGKKNEQKLRIIEGIPVLSAFSLFRCTFVQDKGQWQTAGRNQFMWSNRKGGVADPQNKRRIWGVGGLI